MIWVKRMALAVSTVLVFLVLVELGYRWRGMRPFPRVTERTKFWRYDPDLGWSHTPGQSGWFETAVFRTRVTINAKGLRDEEHGYERTGEGKRMLVLGDSFAWGFGVERTERFTEVLERRAGLEVINAGVSGYSTAQELLWLRTEGLKYDVDHVLLVFCADDEAQNHRDRVFHVYGKPRFVLEDSGLVLKNVPVPEPPKMARLAHWVRCRSALFNALTGEKGPPPAPQEEAAARCALTTAMLREMRDLAVSKGAGFTIVVAARPWWGRPGGAPIEAFVTALRREGLRVLDMEAAPGFEPGEMIIGGHWNKEGHAFVAEQLLRIGGFDRVR